MNIPWGENKKTKQTCVLKKTFVCVSVTYSCVADHPGLAELG